MGRTCRENGRMLEIFQHVNNKPTGKRPPRRPRRRQEYNVRIDLKEIGANARNWVNAAQDRDYLRSLVNGAMNLNVPQSKRGFKT